MIQLLKNPEHYAGNHIGFVPDHLELGCATGVSFFRLSEQPFHSVIAVQQDDEAKQVVHPYLDRVYVGKAKNYFDSDEDNPTFIEHKERLKNRKPFWYVLSKEGQIHQVDVKTEKITASKRLLDKSAQVISAHIIAKEIFYEKHWRTLLVVVANFYAETQPHQSQSIIKMFDITGAVDANVSPSQVFASEKQLYLNPNLRQLIKPVLVRLPKTGFGFAIGGSHLETGTSQVHLLFLEGSQSIVCSIADKNLFYLTASDTTHSNQSTLLNIAADNLYQIDFAANNQTLKKLAAISCALPPLVVLAPNGEPNIIAVGTLNETRDGAVPANRTKGIFRILSNARLKLLGVLEPNQYHAMQCRWGFIRLLPKQSGAMMKELDLSYDELRNLSPDQKWGDEQKYGEISFGQIYE